MMDSIELYNLLKDLRSIKLQPNLRRFVLDCEQTRTKFGTLLPGDIKRVQVIAERNKQSLESLRQSRENAIKSMAGVDAKPAQKPTDNSNDFGF